MHFPLSHSRLFLRPAEAVELSNHAFEHSPFPHSLHSLPPLALLPATAVTPLPCTVCGEERYPCGDTCVSVFGLELPDCFKEPGCAVGAFRGSLDRLSAPLNELSPQQAGSEKAAAALEAVAEIDPHFAGRTLAASLRRISSAALCFNITCPPSTNDCLQAPECDSGVCPQLQPLPAGTPCDDGLANTDSDACDGILGVCSGIDFCAGVTCPPPAPCHTPGVCVSGTCTSMRLANGTACDDGDATTVDTCSAGLCVGVDPCAGVVCESPGPCWDAATCILGTCEYPMRPDGEEVSQLPGL